MNLQNYVNMASALIMFLGGLAIIFMYPGGLPNQYRILIGLFVTFYFFVRMGQTILTIKRERRKGRSELKKALEGGDDGPPGPKRP